MIQTHPLRGEFDNFVHGFIDQLCYSPDHVQRAEKLMFWNQGYPKNPMPVATIQTATRCALISFNETKLEFNDWLTFAGSLCYDYSEAIGKGVAISR